MARRETGTRLGGAAITPEQLAASGTEHGHQSAVMQWIALEGRLEHPALTWLFAVPNGGGRTASVGAAMRAEGVKPGVPDLCLPVPRERYAGLYIEMKTPKRMKDALGGNAVEQIKWQRELIRQYHAVCVCYSWGAAVRTLRCYLQGRLITELDTGWRWTGWEIGDALPVVE